MAVKYEQPNFFTGFIIENFDTVIPHARVWPSHLHCLFGDISTKAIGWFVCSCSSRVGALVFRGG